MGDSYEGQIRTVIEEQIRNRFTGQRQLEPVIYFEDGWKLVPNITQRQALIQFWGPHTEDWEGRRLIVFRQRIERTDKSTGLVRVLWEKRVKLPIAQIHKAV
jgi:hypothetical protein